MSYTGGQLVASYLTANKVPYLVGIPGHGCLPLLDAFHEVRNEIPIIQVRHEQSAVHLADGYYRASGQPLAVFTSIGPGAVNTAVGLATSYVDSTSVLVFTGDVHTYMFGRGVLQEVERQHDSDLSRLFAPVTKRYWQVTRVDQLPLTLASAHRAAVSGRPGPVLVSLPMDVQADAIDVPTPGRTELPAPPAGDSSAVARAANLLMSAERPVILAGGGVLLAGASGELRRLAQATGAAVVETYAAKSSFPEDHFQHAGFPGSKGTDHGNAACRTADVILAVGCRFADECTSSYVSGITFSIPPARLIHVDIDAFEIGKNYPVDIGIVGDARTVLGQLYEAVAEHKSPDRAAFWALLAERKAAWEKSIAERSSSDVVPMTVSRVLRELRLVAEKNAMIVSAAGHPQAQVLQEFPLTVPRTNVTAAGFSTMGFTIPAAMGAKLAAGSRQVIGVAGDGDFLMSLHELATVAQYGIAVVYIVLNNNGWHSIRDLQMDLYGEDRSIAAEFSLDGNGEGPDFVEIARGFKIHSERARTPEDFRQALRKALALQGPAVLEVPIHRQYPMSSGPVSGWWDVPIPAYLTARRAAYERVVSSVRHEPSRSG